MSDSNAPLPGGTLAVLIIGSGFSGLAMGIRCRQTGIGPFAIVEKSDGIGGTWHENTYPGAACDIPSHLYSLSYVPKHDWSRLYPQQPEIAAYLRETARAQGLLPHLHLHTRVIGASWDEAEAVWRVETNRGPLRARAIVSGMGGLHHPALPNIPGRESFAGTAFHSASWDHACDLRGKRVGVIGTGASAIQFVPQIAPEAAHLTLFQRTPAWIMPKHDRPITERAKRAYRRLPLVRRLFRAQLFWIHEVRAFMGFTKVSKLTGQAEGLARRHLAKAVPDKALRAKLTPRYRLGCKRVLISDDFYPTMMRPNVSLETGGIARITPSGVILEDGSAHALDAIIYATGFDLTGGFQKLDLVGRGGLTLPQAWRDGMGAFQGITVAGFPNLFLLMGPNTGLGHNSMILMIEAQVEHALSCLKAMRDKGVRVFDVKPEAQARFLADVQARMADSIWQTGGCTSWYQDHKGRNTALWPGSVLAYRRGARRARVSDYRVS
ncbi:flavin-containing monooxygenase [Methylobacterium soli]|uniref:NAD(P)/FAD-dependent oxidoreductase n=1 Tax=Methylobacterium soli TaxID=553447 RepID=A0A6L3SZU7_9HYPH|nr:NAD(P)/FAD-dependent oxidoreductase [Methylobacterium soli]KAB1076383.1 NAD(P)/FAD-dependent oxidoreductase [Methylobacterium soli]GJE46344.1 Baeyer-Villiger monooxygenase [Methylobacterium soli]